LRRREEEG